VAGGICLAQPENSLFMVLKYFRKTLLHCQELVVYYY
jgi:hypothetical protein